MPRRHQSLHIRPALRDVRGPEYAVSGRAMRFTSLGSGSGGNALIVEAAATRIMIDCGFSYAETSARLARVGLQPEDIHAVIITHEHDDHIGGVARFAGRTGIPVYLSAGTLAAMGAKLAGVRCNCFDPHVAFQIRDAIVRPFPVPHDAREPAQCVIDDGQRKLGVLTDVGTPTPHIRAMLGGCAGLFLECNYDTQMLRDGPYPAALKARIDSRHGHLRNSDAAALLSALDASRLQHVVAAHLSETNNTPQHARDALAGALGTRAADIHVATQSGGVPWLELS